MNLLLRCLAVFLSPYLTQRCDARPPPCKEGKFYEESVFSYFNCSVCVEQSHYSNCDLCCSTTTVEPTTTFSTQTTEPLANINVLQTSDASKGKENSSGDDELFGKKAAITAVVAFVTGFLSAMSLVFVIKCYMKSRERRSTTVTAPLQETQPSSTASPVVAGCTVREATDAL